MKRALILSVTLVACHATTALAGPFFSVDPASPAIPAIPTTPNDILERGDPPTVLIPEAALGLTGFDNLNALSFGNDRIFGDIFFSVDRVAIGAPGTAVDMQSFPGAEAAGDIFTSNFTGTNGLWLDEEALGLTPGFFGDDLDALNLNAPVGAPYFSVDFLSALNGFGTPGMGVANDIFVGSSATLYADGDVDIGLLPDDDLDALILHDIGTPGVVDPGLDLALFSLDTFSPSTFTGGAGVFSPGDVLITDFSGAFGLFAPAGALGLDPTDNLNALSNPEPGSLALLGVGLTGFVVQRRRKKKQQAKQAAV